METLEPKPEESSVPEPAVESKPVKPERQETVWDTLRSLLIVLAGVLCIRTFVAEATVIPTGSMESTILVGDHVFLNKLLYGPRLPYTSLRMPPLKEVHRQDIVAFRYPVNPSVMFVKRVIGVGGDVVKIENKRVYLNGKPLFEPYVQYLALPNQPLRDDFPPSLSLLETFPAYLGLDPAWARRMPSFIQNDGLHVPPGYLFAMGDNRDNSLDSRFWGFVPLENVVGEPLFVYWSYDAPNPKDWQADSLAERLKFDGSIIWNFLTRTRWSRTGQTF
ncbi:MAG: signal peptidase I [Terriglobia bacterium]|jgi:signal peptidase I